MKRASGVMQKHLCGADATEFTEQTARSETRDAITAWRGSGIDGEKLDPPRLVRPMLAEAVAVGADSADRGGKSRRNYEHRLRFHCAIAPQKRSVWRLSMNCSRARPSAFAATSFRVCGVKALSVAAILSGSIVSSGIQARARFRKWKAADVSGP